MSPELLDAVKDRIGRGYTDDQIREELHQSGYDDATIDSVIAETKGPASEIPVPGNSSLPGVFTLINTSVKYAISRSDLWLLMAAPALVTLVIQFFNGALGSDAPANMPWSMTLLSLLVTLAGVILAFMAAYIVGLSSQQTVSLGEAWQWVKTNWLALIWIGFLTSAAAMGASLLFLIPGIIVSFYLILSNLAFIREGHRGLDALMRSRELIYGKWWAVVGRSVGIAIFYMAVFFVIGLPIGLLVGLGGEVGLLIVSLIMLVVQTLLNIAGIKVLVSIYDALQTTKPTYQAEVHTAARKKYQILAWLGPIAIVLMIALAIVFASMNEALMQEFEAELTAEEDWGMTEEDWLELGGDPDITVEEWLESQNY